MSLQGDGKDVPSEPPEHEGESYRRVVGGMVVRAAAAGLGFVTPGSTALLSVGGSVSGQNSLSLLVNAPMTDRSIFV